MIWDLLPSIVVTMAMAAYLLWISKANRKKASRQAEELFSGLLRVRSLGSTRTLSLAALAAECVIECSHNSRTFVHLIPELTNPTRPNMDMLLLQYKPEIRHIRKDWVDAVHSLSEHFPGLEAAWRDWIVAYSEMADLPLEADLADALRILRELLAAKRCLLRILSEVLSLVFFVEF
ncbi:hypothetical protein [Streptomyces sp. NPDC005046]